MIRWMIEGLMFLYIIPLLCATVGSYYFGIGIGGIMAFCAFIGYLIIGSWNIKHFK